jgi:hypothetical protein
VLLFFAAVFGLVGRFFSSVTTIELSPGVAACATGPEKANNTEVSIASAPKVGLPALFICFIPKLNA